MDEIKLSVPEKHLCDRLEALANFHEDMEDLHSTQTLHAAITRIHEAAFQAQQDEINIQHLESNIERIFSITQALASDYLQLNNVADSMASRLIDLNHSEWTEGYLKFVKDRQELFKYLPHFLNNEI